MSDNSQSADKGEHRYRLLVADDDPNLLELMSANLEDDDTEVVCAANGIDARDSLVREDFDLAIVDLGMPGLDGFELITQLRQDPRTVDLPVIVVTGRHDKLAIEEAFASGATTFVTKPVNWTLFKYQARFVIRSGHVKKDLRLALETADRASKAKDNLIKLLSHELRSPLNILVGFAEILKRDMEGDLSPEQQAHLSDIDQAGKRLSEVLSDVLFFSRLNNGHHEIKPSNTGLDELIEDATVAMKSKAKAKNITLSHSDFSEQRELIAESKLILDALKRLTDNAVKFSPDGAEVRLTAHSLADGSAVLAVQDNGPGIAMHTLQRCMKPFEQADKALTRSEQGMGLGLAIAKMIAEMHGGKLIVDAKPGKGTTASIWMPPSCLVTQQLNLKAG